MQNSSGADENWETLLLSKFYLLVASGSFNLNQVEIRFVNYFIKLNTIALVFCISGLIAFCSAQDDHTVLLYTFETGKGKVVKDLSGQGNDGKFDGKKLSWVRASSAVDWSLVGMGHATTSWCRIAKVYG